MNPKLEYHLIELFKAVADEMDNDTTKVPKVIREAFFHAWKTPEVKRFYGRLVDENPFNRMLGK